MTQELFNSKYFEKSQFGAARSERNIKILSGEYHSSSAEDEVLETILGSCIACCLHDPERRIGGMNHFLVPGDGNDPMSSARFGANAMELLLNDLIKRGGQKSRFEVKIFGGASLTGNSAKVGHRNILFIRDFIVNEGLKLVSEDVGGNYPRRLNYYPYSGKALVRKLKMTEDSNMVINSESNYLNKISGKKDDTTLF